MPLALTQHPPGGARAALHILTRRHFSPFKVFIAREKRIVVMLNPKVGTTTFRHIIGRAYLEALGREDVSQGRYRVWNKARHFPLAPLRDYWHAFSHPQDYDFFCFVRNPYARLKSAWIDKLAFGHETDYPPSIRGKVIREIRRFAREHDLPGHQNDSAVPFATFVAFIAAQPTGTRNHHWDEQFSVLLMDAIGYNQIFKMETQFIAGTQTILSRLGVPEAWSAAALATPPRNESPKSKNALYTPDVAAQVQEIFERDFAALNYDTDSWRGL